MENKKWIEFTINSPIEFEDIIYSIIYKYEIEAIEIIDYRTFLDLKDKKPYWIELDDNLIEKLDNIIIKAYIIKDENSESTISNIKLQLNNISKDIEVKTPRIIENQDWSKEWKKFYKPIKIGESIVIKPSWEEYNKKEKDIIVEIDPGMAFGTGTHETTSLCVEMLQEIDNKSKIVYDVGTGSGVLSIVSAKLGANKVYAIDIDPLSAEAAQINSEFNNTTDIIEVIEGDLLENKFEDADIVITNILADVIITLIPDMTKIIKNNGYFLASGIIKEKKELIVESLKKFGFEIEKIKEKKDWVCILSKYINA
ncbi:50S ribosomal protein L11 methyltransferase [Miniphocaeibacter massiliensis]|uniref:50S ribosomal protein L11 methyltransferase n=1 Tax=Miniphocaeibacter massiliensis TaxID=2041841 RepID=UPI000C076129|nr:50S ribosomal protein L11 methyltransferase [Miniphocaeibacter massiliensis]